MRKESGGFSLKIKKYIGEGLPPGLGHVCGHGDGRLLLASWGTAFSPQSQPMNMRSQAGCSELTGSPGSSYTTLGNGLWSQVGHPPRCSAPGWWSHLRH